MTFCCIGYIYHSVIEQLINDLKKEGFIFSFYLFFIHTYILVAAPTLPNTLPPLPFPTDYCFLHSL